MSGTMHKIRLCASGKMENSKNKIQVDSILKNADKRG